MFTAFRSNKIIKSWQRFLRAPNGNSSLNAIRIFYTLVQLLDSHIQIYTHTLTHPNEVCASDLFGKILTFINSTLALLHYNSSVHFIIRIIGNRSGTVQLSHYVMVWCVYVCVGVCVISGRPDYRSILRLRDRNVVFFYRISNNTV